MEYKKALTEVRGTIEGRTTKVHGLLYHTMSKATRRKDEYNMSEMLHEEELLQEAESFIIKDDATAEWCLKNTLTVCGDSVADEDGQIIPCITAVDRPAVFKIGK